MVQRFCFLFYFSSIFVTQFSFASQDSGFDKKSNSKNLRCYRLAGRGATKQNKWRDSESKIIATRDKHSEAKMRASYEQDRALSWPGYKVVDLKLLEKPKAAYDQGDLILARDLALKVWHKTKSGSPHTSAFLAKIYQRLGDIETAVFFRKETIRLEGETPLNLSTLIQSLMSLGRLDEAKEYIDKLLSQRRIDPIAYVHLADYYYEKMQYEKAIEAAEFALDQLPERLVELPMKLMIFSLKESRGSEAVISFIHKVREQYPIDPQAFLVEEMTALTILGRESDVFQVLKNLTVDQLKEFKVLSYYTRFMINRIGRGDAYLEFIKNDLFQKVEQVIKGEMNPSIAQNYMSSYLIMRAQVSIFEGENEKALNFLDQIVMSSERDLQRHEIIHYYSVRVEALVRLGRNNEAKNEAQNLHFVGRDTVADLTAKVRIFNFVEDHESAFRYIETAWRNSPQSIKMLALRFHSLIMTGRLIQAEEELFEASRTPIVGAHATRETAKNIQEVFQYFGGQIFLLRGEYNKAYENFQQLRQRKMILWQKAGALAGKGQLIEAKKILEEIIMVNIEPPVGVIAAWEALAVGVPGKGVIPRIEKLRDSMSEEMNQWIEKKVDQIKKLEEETGIILGLDRLESLPLPFIEALWGDSQSRRRVLEQGQLSNLFTEDPEEAF